MIRRLFKRRDVRKFLGNRLAVISLVVVSIYLLTAVIVSGMQAVPKADCFQIVGPKSSAPDFAGHPGAEERVRRAEFYVNRVEQGLKQHDKWLKRQRAKGSQPTAQEELDSLNTVLDDIALGELRVATKPADELQDLLDEAWDIYDELEEEEITATPEKLAQFEKLESIAHGLFEPLDGRAALRRNVEKFLGTDNQGRSILLRALYSIGVAMKVGVVVGLISVIIGSILGGAAGYFGGVVDTIITWLFTTFSSIPSLVLLVLLAYMFTGSSFEGTLVPLYIAFISTYWIGPCRQIRGETLKIKELEYVHAAQALGLNRFMILLRHILPNTVHLMLINFSLLFIGAIKGEVILTYLGLGLKPGAGTSWGIMISQSRTEVVQGFFWQIGTATFLMFVLVLAFNILSDALQDAFDPKSL